MHPYEVYKRFLAKVNKNDTNTNVSVPKGIFVVLFNEQKRQWLDDKIKQLESSSMVEDISSLLQIDTELIKLKDMSDRSDFKLPDNFYRRVSGYAKASNNVCKDKKLYTWFVKPKDINVLLQNDNQKPSFEYEETIALLNNKQLSVYKDDFKVDSFYLSYYREPVDIDIEGYRNLDNTFSINKEVDLDDFSIEEIINRTAIEVVTNYESSEQLQLAKHRQQQNEGTIS